MVIDPAVVELAAALTVGLIIGLERGWRARDQVDGARVAGFRTFALIGLLGGVLASLRETLGVMPMAAGLIGVAVVAGLSYREGVRTSGSLSATSAFTVLLTYSLGALAATGTPTLALGAAVVAAVLLDQKPRLHRLLQLIDQREMGAALQMLVLSVVVLPLLPDSGYGPYESLNPYRLWWAVVLVAGLSFAGHVAMRVSGPQRGLLLSGLLGGLVSSTATTMALSRRVRSEPDLIDAAVAGVLAACGVMFLRMAVIVAALQPALGKSLGPVLVASGLALFVIGALAWRRRRPEVAAEPAESAAPFDLSAALFFGALLGLLAVLVRAAQDLLGSAGLYGLAALSGLVDVDAIVISVTHMQATGSLLAAPAAITIGLAASANMLSKAGIAWWVGGLRMGRSVLIGNLVAAAVGVALGALVFWR